jgi:hypothetical protein
MAARLRFKVPPTKVRSFKFDYLSSKAELGSTGSLPFGSFLFKSFWVRDESLECSTSLEAMRAGAHFCSRAHMMRYRRFDYDRPQKAKYGRDTFGQSMGLRDVQMAVGPISLPANSELSCARRMTITKERK